MGRSLPRAQCAVGSGRRSRTLGPGIEERCEMRILLASSSSGSRGGGELYLLYLGRALAARGHDVILWASSHSRMNELAASFAAFGKVQRSDYVNTYDRRLRSVASYLDGASAT